MNEPWWTTLRIIVEKCHLVYALEIMELHEGFIRAVAWDDAIVAYVVDVAWHHTRETERQAFVREGYRHSVVVSHSLAHA